MSHIILNPLCRCIVTPLTVCSFFAILLTSHNVGANDLDVFAGPPAQPEPWLTEARPEKGTPVRRLTIEERVGIARSGALVRVPLFFHAGECRDPNGLEIHAAGDTKEKNPILYQADDIRRSPAGDIARMHIYFLADLNAWEQKQYDVFRGVNPGRDAERIPLILIENDVKLAGEDLKLTFRTKGDRAGIITDIESSLGPVSLPHKQWAPRLVLVRQSADLKEQRRTTVSYLEKDSVDVRDVRVGAGPLFAKCIVRVGPKGIPDHAEYTYIVPRKGNWFLQRQRLHPDEYDTTDVVGCDMNFLLQGRLVLGKPSAEQKVVKIPSGLRKLVRGVHGYTTSAIVNSDARLSLIPIPCVQQAVPAIQGGSGPDGYVSIPGPASFKRTRGANSDPLRSFWTEVRYVWSSSTVVEDLWTTSLPHRQPLVAVVDEAWLKRDDLHSIFARMMSKVEGHHSIGWEVDAARLYTSGQMESFLKRYQSSCGKAERHDKEHWLAGARKAYDKMSEGGTRKIAEWEKGKASGGLDPWNITYGTSPLPVFSALVRPSEGADLVCLAMSEAQRAFNGRVDEFGFSYIDCFHSAFNMQVGSILLGLHAGCRFENHALSQFFRDCSRTPAVLDIYGHGERTYPSLRSEGGNSDVLYQMTSDYFLRMAEIATGEDLWLHPMVHGRYLDMVDVTADLMHRMSDATKTPSWHRANFMRGQCHDHRWEAWSAGPFARLLKQDGNGPLVGITEACYYARRLERYAANRWNVTYVFLADVAIDKTLSWPSTRRGPLLPGTTQVKRESSGNLVRWSKVEGDILGYRVYRAPQIGGPWTFLNSPYVNPPGRLIPITRFLDSEGKQGDRYFVTAVDKNRRESRWFPDER